MVGKLEVAREHAFPTGVPGGVVLRTTDDAATTNDNWSWEPSPNDFEEEDEILLHGIRINLEVLDDEHS